MRSTVSPGTPPSLGLTDEVVERLARLEEQMRHVVIAVEKLANRDAELDASLRAMCDRFTSALASQSEMFRASLKEVTQNFVGRDDWAFWKSLLMAALFALMAFSWKTLTGDLHR